MKRKTIERTESQRSDKQNSYIWLMVAIGELIKIAKKQHRSKADHQKVEYIEAAVYSVVSN